jgi:hypothetical protein
VKDNVALAYAVTVHRAEGLTTDGAVLLVDGATTAEHLYVGLTRGREHNLACVVREPFDDGHRHQPAPSAHDLLAAALRRADLPSCFSRGLRGTRCRRGPPQSC